MYKVIGGDQKVYGPATEEQLRKWWSEGRLNTLTLVLVEGSNEWKPLGVIPEFAASITTVPPVVMPPPVVQQPAPTPAPVQTSSVASVVTPVPTSMPGPTPMPASAPLPISPIPAVSTSTTIPATAPAAPAFAGSTPVSAPTPTPAPGMSPTIPPVPPPPANPATSAPAPGPIPVVPPVQVVVSMPPKPGSQGNTAATTGFVFAILSIIPCCCFTYIFAILGLIFSIIGLNQAKNLPNEDGKNLAIAGIIICALALVLNSSLPFFFNTDELRHFFPRHSF